VPRTAASALAAVIGAVLVVAVPAAAQTDQSDPFRYVQLLPGDQLTDGQPIRVTNKGFGADMSDVRVEQCTTDLTLCDPTNVVVTTTGRNGRIGPHGNPQRVDDVETVPVEFTVKARFTAGGRTIDCVPTACVIRVGGGTEYARHAPLGFGVPLATAPRPTWLGANGGSPSPGIPPEETSPAPSADQPDGQPAATVAPGAESVDGASGAEPAPPTTRAKLEMLPASSEGFWSVVPVGIGLVLLAALVLLVLGLRRPRA